MSRLLQSFFAAFLVSLSTFGFLPASRGEPLASAAPGMTMAVAPDDDEFVHDALDWSVTRPGAVWQKRLTKDPDQSHVVLTFNNAKIPAMNVPQVYNDVIFFMVGDKICLAFVVAWNGRIPDGPLPTVGVNPRENRSSTEGSFGSPFILAARGHSWRPRRTELGDPGRQPIRQAIAENFWKVQTSSGDKCAEPKARPHKLRLPRIDKYDPMVAPTTISWSSDFKVVVYSDVSSVSGVYDKNGLRGAGIQFVENKTVEHTRSYETFLIGDCAGGILAEPFLRLKWGYSLNLTVAADAKNTKATVFNLLDVASSEIEHPGLSVLDGAGGAVDNGRLVEDAGSLLFEEIPCPP